MKKHFKKTDAAIVFSKDGTIAIEVPKINPVPDHVLTATALAVLLTQQNKSLFKLVTKQVKKFVELSDKIAAEEKGG